MVGWCYLSLNILNLVTDLSGCICSSTPPGDASHIVHLPQAPKPKVSLCRSCPGGFVVVAWTRQLNNSSNSFSWEEYNIICSRRPLSSPASSSVVGLSAQTNHTLLENLLLLVCIGAVLSSSCRCRSCEAKRHHPRNEPLC